MAVLTISKIGEPGLVGDVFLVEGDWIELTQIGQDIEIAMENHAVSHGHLGGDEMVYIGGVAPAPVFPGFIWWDNS